MAYASQSNDDFMEERGPNGDVETNDDQNQNFDYNENGRFDDETCDVNDENYDNDGDNCGNDSDGCDEIDTNPIFDYDDHNASDCDDKSSTSNSDVYENPEELKVEILRTNDKEKVSIGFKDINVGTDQVTFANGQTEMISSQSEMKSTKPNEKNKFEKKDEDNTASAPPLPSNNSAKKNKKNKGNGKYNPNQQKQHLQAIKSCMNKNDPVSTGNPNSKTLFEKEDTKPLILIHNKTSYGNNNNNKNNGNNNNNKNNGNNGNNINGNFNNKNNGNNNNQNKNNGNNNNNNQNKNNGNNNNNNNNSNKNNGNQNSGNQNNGGGISFPSCDVWKKIQELLRQIKKKDHCHPLDSWILRLHYRYAYTYFVIMFFAVWSNWFAKSNIEIIAEFDATYNVPYKIMNICLSYMHVVEATGALKYIGYYRWIPWCFLVLAGVYYLPRFMSKLGENEKLKALIYELYSNIWDHQDYSWKQNEKKIKVYLLRYLGTHDMFYMLYIFFHVLAWVSNIMVFFLIDLLLNGEFQLLFFNFLITNRDYTTHSDKLSRVFPPFANCNVGKSKKLNNQREETYGLHLPLMEFYEKVFLVLWIVLVLLIIVGAVSILILLFTYTKQGKLLYLQGRKCPKHLQKLQHQIAKKLNAGDVYVLFCFRKVIGESNFQELIEGLSEIHSNSSPNILKLTENKYEIS